MGSHRVWRNLGGPEGILRGVLGSREVWGGPEGVLGSHGVWRGLGVRGEILRRVLGSHRIWRSLGVLREFWGHREHLEGFWGNCENPEVLGSFWKVLGGFWGHIERVWGVV